MDGVQQVHLFLCRRNPSPGSTARQPASRSCLQSGLRAVSPEAVSSTQEALGAGAWVVPLLLYTSGRNFCHLLIINSVPSLKNLAKSLSVPYNTGFFKGQFLSCLLSQETWFRDSLKGDQILWLYENSPFQQWEMGKREDRELQSQLS